MNSLKLCKKNAEILFCKNALFISSQLLQMVSGFMQITLIINLIAGNLISRVQFLVISYNFISVLSTANAKTVHYLIAADGNPWVWVLGDDKDDKPDLIEMFKSKFVSMFVLFRE